MGSWVDSAKLGYVRLKTRMRRSYIVVAAPPSLGLSFWNNTPVHIYDCRN